MHIPFVCMVELKFPAHFPVDHLADPGVSRLVLLLCQFAAFAYYYYNNNNNNNNNNNCLLSLCELFTIISIMVTF